MSDLITAEKLAELMATESIGPGVFIFPRDAAGVERLQAHCQALQLPAPVRWHAGQLHCSLRDLASGRAAAAPPAPELIPAQARLAGIGANVVVLCAQPAAAMKTLMARYKDEGIEWPIFCMVTPNALGMSLAKLFEYLGEDRMREAIRARRLHQQQHQQQ